MSSDANANDDCNCNVVVTEQPHCIVGHPNVLDSGDAMEETTISSVQDPSKKARSLTGARRLRWMSTVTVTVVKEGLPTKVTPFLADGNNWMDIMFVRHLLVDKPFEAAHGQNKKAWDSTAFYLSKAVDPNGNLIFGDAGCNGRQLKARFQELMTFMKRLEHRIPRDSGCDNQNPSPAQLQLQLDLEELLDMHTAITNNTASVNAEQAADKALDKENAETLRRAAMGEMSTKDLRNLKARNKRSSASISSSAGDASNLVSPTNGKNMMAMNDALGVRMEARGQAKDAIRREKLALKARQLEMKAAEKERAFKLQEEERARTFKLQEQQLQLQTAMFQFFQTTQDANKEK
jgi:hypothetical protein